MLIQALQEQGQGARGGRHQRFYLAHLLCVLPDQTGAVLGDVVRCQYGSQFDEVTVQKLHHVIGIQADQLSGVETLAKCGVDSGADRLFQQRRADHVLSQDHVSRSADQGDFGHFLGRIRSEEVFQDLADDVGTGIRVRGTVGAHRHGFGDLLEQHGADCRWPQHVEGDPPHADPAQRGRVGQIGPVAGDDPDNWHLQGVLQRFRLLQEQGQRAIEQVATPFLLSPAAKQALSFFDDDEQRRAYRSAVESLEGQRSEFLEFCSPAGNALLGFPEIGRPEMGRVEHDQSTRARPVYFSTRS